MTYNLQLVHPTIVGVEIKSSSPSATIIPMELCHLKKDQPFQRLLDADIAQKVLEHVKRPKERRKAIDDSLRDLDYANAPALRQNDVSIRQSPALTEAQQLDPPSLMSMQQVGAASISGAT